MAILTLFLEELMKKAVSGPILLFPDSLQIPLTPNSHVGMLDVPGLEPPGRHQLVIQEYLVPAEFYTTPSQNRNNGHLPRSQYSCGLTT